MKAANIAIRDGLFSTSRWSSARDSGEWAQRMVASSRNEVTEGRLRAFTSASMRLETSALGRTLMFRVFVGRGLRLVGSGRGWDGSVDGMLDGSRIWQFAALCFVLGRESQPSGEARPQRLRWQFV